MEKFKVIIVEDVKLELKGTEEIFRHEIPNAEVIGTAMTELNSGSCFSNRLLIWFSWIWDWADRPPSEWTSVPACTVSVRN